MQLSLSYFCTCKESLTSNTNETHCLTKLDDSGIYTFSCCYFPILCPHIPGDNVTHLPSLASKAGEMVHDCTRPYFHMETSANRKKKKQQIENAILETQFTTIRLSLKHNIVLRFIFILYLFITLLGFNVGEQL